MPDTVQIGYLDNAGHPCIRIRVFGLSEQFAREFEAMIDTGFTGFLMMPLMPALPLALTLYGTSTWSYADGSSGTRLLAFGSVDVNGEKTSGVIVLEPSGQRPLLGVEFLKRSGKALLFGSGGCVLVSEEELRKVAKLDPTNRPGNEPSPR